MIKALLSVFAVALLLSFRPALVPSHAKKIGVYDLDSVHAEMPAYQRVLDSAAAYRKSLDSQLELMRSEYAAKQTSFEKDSASMDTLTKALKRKELERMEENLHLFETNAVTDHAVLKKTLIASLDQQIFVATQRLAAKKQLDDIIPKSSLEIYRRLNPGTLKIISVTNDVCRELGIR